MVLAGGLGWFVVKTVCPNEFKDSPRFWAGCWIEGTKVLELVCVLDDAGLLARKVV